MKKALSILVLLMTTTTFAGNVGNVNLLKQAADNLQLKLAVDWDQQDTEFYNSAMYQFAAEVEKLQEQGLTNKEVLSFAKSQIKNEQLAKEFNEILNVVETEKLDVKATNELMMQAISSSYSTGASWSGEAVAIFGALLVILVIAATASGSVYQGYYEECYYDWYWDEYVCYYY